jgi:TatA/E family protein of Tat protein translocase
MMEGLFRNPLHLLVLLVVVMMIFGTSKLADAGKHLGRSIKEFKKEVHADDEPAAATTVQTSENLLSCPACGESLPSGAMFCLKCGHKLQADQPRRCSSCQAELAPNARFCMACGQAVAVALTT